MTYIIIALGIGITIIPFYKIYKDGKLNLQNVSVIVCGIILLILSFIKNCRDNAKEKEQNTVIVDLRKNTDSLNMHLEEMRSNRLIDSTRNADFLIRLENKFNIGRDSVKNIPIQINTFNTNIRDVNNLQIGPR